MPRRALLLAIADYDPLPALSYVANDISRLKAALTRAGFDPKHIEAIGAGAGEIRARELTTTRLRGAICDFLDKADQHDDMLIFFSGHGIELDGRRVLLPQDFSPKRPEHATGMATDSWISVYSRGSKARSVVVLIDACREGARCTLAPSKSAPFEEDAPLKNEYGSDATDGPTLAFLYGCDSGEESRRDCKGEDCSAFTRAFAEAIELENGPAELEAIAVEARRRLAGFSNGIQTLVASGRAGRGERWEHLVIKEDEAARFRERLKRSNWSRRLAETELFQNLEAALPTFATQLRAIAMRAEEQVAEARRVLPIQRWRDERAWSRQATRIRHVFLSSTEAEEVAAAELAIILAVPFVYETALAAVETRLVAAGAIPDPEAVSSSGYLSNAWRNSWRDSDAAQIRRALIARNKQDAADDHSCWWLVDFCHTSGELWDAQGGAQDRTGWALDAVSMVVAPAPFPEITQDRRVCEILSAARLLRLARLMFASFDDLTLDTTSGVQSLNTQFSCGEFANQLTINEVRVAHLLNLGSQLALDSRRMPSVLAEHIGTNDVLSAGWLRLQLADAEWHTRTPDGSEPGQGERWFDLRLDCANDAVDAALLAVVDGLESYRTRLTQRQDEHAAAMRDLLPAGFTVNRLNATPSGWHPTRPPLRFELDRTRIIGLLMGQQLYGDRWPALRELYQNALDACRYRRASEQLAVHEGRARPSRSYEGRIVIRFGVDSGRRFVECVDDGIGMADRHIRRLFACAGQRFADSHEFHIDRARWDEAGIKFFPNSRFGVGVLSYFMLAEELDIASRRWFPPMDLAPASVHARIIGSGSLFRLDPVIDPTRLADDYGTSVRLYLREDASDNDTLLKSILDWLLLPEVSVTIWPEVGAPLELAAGQPTDLFCKMSGNALLPVPGSEDTRGVPRVFLAPNIPRLHHRSDDSWAALVDGIGIGVVGRPWPSCIVVNLKEDLRSTVTVDRRQVYPGEAEIEAVLRLIRESGGAALLGWNSPDFVQLHQTLRELHPDVAADADAALRVAGRPSIATALPISGLTWPFSGAGISDLDPEIACEILLSHRVNIYQMSSDADISRLREAVIRGAPDRSVDPIVTRAMFHRASELGDAGLSLPNWLERAVLFETRNALQSFPARCGPVMEVINGCGRIALREALRWIEFDLVPVLDAARKIAVSSPSLAAFDFDRLEELQPSLRSLCRLSFGNELTWIELAYFSVSQGLPFGDVLVLAHELSLYGVSIPDPEVMPPNLELSAKELETLGYCFSPTSLPNYCHVLPLFDDDNNARYYLSTGVLNELKVKIKRTLKTNKDPPKNLERRQEIFLSDDIDGDSPFLNRMTLYDAFERARDTHFASLHEVIKLSRSLEDTQVDFGRILTLDDHLVAQFDAMLITDAAALIVTRLFHGFDRCRSASVWDLALAATVGEIRPQALLPVLDLLEHCGGDVSRCREFLAFCDDG